MGSCIVCSVGMCLVVEFLGSESSIKYGTKRLVHQAHLTGDLCLDRNARDCAARAC